MVFTGNFSLTSQRWVHLYRKDLFFLLHPLNLPTPPPPRLLAHVYQSGLEHLTVCASLPVNSFVPNCVWLVQLQLQVESCLCPYIPFPSWRFSISYFPVKCIAEKGGDNTGSPLIALCL